MRKIDLMIVGAQKAATTSLKNYLGEHPQIVTHPQIEFDYFVRDEAYARGYEEAFRKHFGDPSAIGDDKKIVAKNVNMCSHPKAIQRLKEHNPDCILVFIVRNPVDRAYSSYSMEVFNGFKDDFSEIVRVIDDDDKMSSFYRIFLRLGQYSEFVETFLRQFGREQVCVFLFEDFKKNPSPICVEIFQGLGVDQTFQPNFERRHNQSRIGRSQTYATLLARLRAKDSKIKNLAKKILPSRLFGKLAVMAVEVNKSKTTFPPMDPDVRKYLKEYFGPFNRELEKQLNIDLSAWD